MPDAADENEAFQDGEIALPPGKPKLALILLALALVFLVVGSALTLLVEDEPQWPPTPTPLLAPSRPALPVAAIPGVPDPQPAGPVPPGKIWSAEHGHWHDAPFTTGATQVPLTQSPASGTPGPGMVWSEEHGHWHGGPYMTPPTQVPPEQGKVRSSSNTIRLSPIGEITDFGLGQLPREALVWPPRPRWRAEMEFARPHGHSDQR